LVSSEGLLTALGIPEGQRSADLLVGATLFRVGLALLGLAILVIDRLPIWRPAPRGAPTVSGRGDPQLDRASLASPRRLFPVAALTAILAAATVLRLHALDSGLWLDEIITSALYANQPVGLILTTFGSENQHFLYSLLASLSVQAFGEGAWTLRLPAALLGVACVWALYLLGREVTTTSESLFAAALLAFSYVHIWFSQNARGYSGLLLLTLLSSLFLLRAVRTGDARSWLWYAVAAALGVYVHATMIFVLAGHGLIYLAFALRHGTTRRNLWAGGIIGFGMTGLLTFQLYALVLPQVLVGMGREESLVQAWKNPLWTVLEIAKGMELSFAGNAVALAAIIVFAAGVVSYARTTPAVLGLLVIPAALGAATIIGLGHHLWPRFFFFAMGFAVLVVIRGAFVLGETAGRLVLGHRPLAAWAGPACCLALVAVSLSTVPRAYGPKQDYVGAARFIEARRQTADAVSVAGLAAFPYQYYRKDWIHVQTLAELDEVRARAPRTWLVYTFPPVLEAVSPEIMSAIKNDFETVSRFDGTVAEGAVFVMRYDAPQGVAHR
jgi:hypothetical protein